MKRGLPLGLGVCLMLGGGCESDYTLGLDTPTTLGQATPTPTLAVTPPSFSPTPTLPAGTPEPGEFVALLRVEPSPLDFGILTIGCEDEATLTVYNDGSVPIEVINVRLVGTPTALSLSLSDDLLTLEPGGEGHIWVDVEGAAFGTDTLSVEIVATEGLAAKVPVLAQVGEGLVEVTDTYYQEPENDVDVLWVIDNSGSMSDNQKLLAANFDAFMDSFVPLGIEYHMGVVSTDMTSPSDSGRMQGTYADGKHYIDWTMKEEGDEAFRQTIKLLGSNGSGAEQGLWAMEAALSAPLVSTYNAGFLREDAFLAVIFVSDEEDQSPGTTTSATYEQYYIDFLMDLKGGPENVVASAIVAFTQPYGYVRVAVDTGGLVYPIHGDYASILTEVGWVSAGYQTSFPLTEVPAPSGDLNVFVDGVQIPRGPDSWTYDDSRQVVVFAEDAVPRDGARIDLVYYVAGGCVVGERGAAPVPAPVVP